MYVLGLFSVENFNPNLCEVHILESVTLPTLSRWEPYCQAEDVILAAPGLLKDSDSDVKAFGSEDFLNFDIPFSYSWNGKYLTAISCYKHITCFSPNQNRF